MSEPTSKPDNAVPQTPAGDEPPARDKTPHKHASPEQARQQNKGWLSQISLTQLTLMVLTVIFIWQWLDGQRVIGDMQRQLAEKIAEMTASNKASQMMMSQNQDQVRELAAKVTMMETRFAEAQNQRSALEALYNDLSVSRDETVLAEAEQMLLVASQQLQLTANVKAALIAMQSADSRLQRMERPAFNGLRKSIGIDMDQLRALPNVDVPAISLELNGLISAVDELPLVYQQRVAQEGVQHPAPPAEDRIWRQMLREFWLELKQLVRIENTGKSEIPLLAPDQEFFLRENLKLRLMAARLALLSRDENSFRHELKTALLWTTRYFDDKSSQGVRMQTGLKRLADSEIKIDLPDISASLQAVRNFRQAQERAAERSLSRKGAR